MVVLVAALKNRFYYQKLEEHKAYLIRNYLTDASLSEPTAYCSFFCEKKSNETQVNNLSN